MKKKPTAYEKTVRYLSIRSHSRLELERKLRRSFQADEIEMALDRAAKQGYIDDALFARRRATAQRVQKKWGDLRISLDLNQLGVGKRDIESVLRQLEEEHPQDASLQAVIESWIRQHGEPRDLADLRRLHSRCARMGYPPRLLRSKLDRYFGLLGG